MILILLLNIEWRLVSNDKWHNNRLHITLSYCLVFFLHLSPQETPPPPYYSVAVHTQPPLKPYEEVVYGLGPGVIPPIHPHYIPQYPPPVVAPQVTQSCIRKPYLHLPYFPDNTLNLGVEKEMDPYCVFVFMCPAPSKRKRCCQNNAQCYGGWGSALLVLGLLGLAIWLGGILCLFITVVFICKVHVSQIVFVALCI